MHIEPGGSFVGGGFWEPNPEDLKRIRDEFAFDDKPIRKILKAASFVKYFGQLDGDELKTAPSGYDRNHPAIDLIRKKQFIANRHQWRSLAAGINIRLPKIINYFTSG